MRIACPACNAAYQVPDESLSEGRVVRCARCGTDWAPLEAIPAASAAEPAAPVVEPPIRAALAPEPVVEPRQMAIEEEIPIPRPLPPPQPPPRGPARRGSIALVLAWIASLGAVGGGLAGLYAGRERVMQAWPPSIRAYAMLHLARPPAASEGRE